MVDPARIIAELNRARVDYIVIGGIAATLHGCPEQTYDLDILYDDSDENRGRLLEALRAIDAQWEAPLTIALLKRQSVFALNTKFGDLDIFTRVPGLADFESARSTAKVFAIGGYQAATLDLNLLIAAKEAAADPNPRKQSALTFLKELRRRV